MARQASQTRLRLQPGCGILITVPRLPVRHPMRFWISPVILIASWLFAAPSAVAAPAMGCAADSNAGLERLLSPSQPKAHATVRSLARPVGLGNIGASFR